MHRYLILLFLFAGILSAKAQKPDTATRKSKTDSVYRKLDSVNSQRFVPRVKKEKIYHPDTTHSPHKAVMRSLMIPGWGQWYNKHGWWWKIPAIYGGLGSLGYAIVTNQHSYTDFLAVAEYQRLGINYTDKMYDNDPRRGLYETYGKYSSDAIINAKEGYRRNRDISILSFLAVWVVNMIDAYIDAKFIHSFSMDNNFGFKVSGGAMEQPVYASNFNTTFTPALKITFTLK